MSASSMIMRRALARTDRRLAAELDDAANAKVSLFLAAGGDARIWPDAVSGRNRYGTMMAPMAGEISFSSTTASTISAQGYEAADRALRDLFGIHLAEAFDPVAWFDRIREDIVAHLGLPGAHAVLAASGTDAEVLALGLVTALSRRPLTNIFIAPDETGNGVPLAAAGRHFSNATAIGKAVSAGEPIDGFAPDRIEVRTVAIRDDAGKPRDAGAMDLEIASIVEAEIKRGRDVLLHVLDCSKTGLTGLTRATAKCMAEATPGRVRVVIDACQFRCPPSQLARDLEDGFMVTVTGSKFAAGPPFSGASLLPEKMAEEIAASGNVPPGLADYSAALDWPPALRDRLDIAFKSEANIGLGLRWIAALESIASLSAIDEAQQHRIVEHFSTMSARRQERSGASCCTPMTR